MTAKVNKDYLYNIVFFFKKTPIKFINVEFLQGPRDATTHKTTEQAGEETYGNMLFCK